MNQVRKVPVDERLISNSNVNYFINTFFYNSGKLIPKELEMMIISCIEQKEFPLLVSLTSGTTVFGAFDPITQVADICEKFKIWLHVDVITYSSYF